MLPEATPVMANPNLLDELPVTRAAILRLLKEEGFASISRIAEALDVTHEAARKHVVDLQRSGWIGSDCSEEAEQRDAAIGRPPVRYCLTPAGDHFFPKRYPRLLITVLDAMREERGERAVTATLARITDERVAGLEDRSKTLSLPRAMNVLRDIYAKDDPFTRVERRGDDYVLIERNCPYLDVALERPEICSTTVSALRRLTGCEVVRERRFQDGDERCEFRVRTATSSRERKETRFEKEPSRNSGTQSR